MRILAAAAVLAGLVLVAVATTTEGAFAVLFGWVPFLGRVLPEVKPDGPSVAVGVVALLLFGVGVHLLGRSVRRPTDPIARRWRVRWTVAAVSGLILLFTAGISVVGITHQIAWLATSERPIIGTGLKRGDSPEGRARVIGIGLMNYQDSHRSLPPGGTFSAGGEMRHSWETHLLPYMGYSAGGIDMSRPWNGPQNERYFKCVLPEFINPGFRTPDLEDAAGHGLSHYAVNSRVMSAGKPMALGRVADGASNTILAGEVNSGFKPWGHPVNWRDPAPGLNRGVKAFGGLPGSGGATFVMADGSVRFISDQTDPAILRGLASPWGGE